jgi:hypothetical protein
MSSTIVFPSTISNPDYPLPVTPEDNSLRTSFDDGSVQSRRKFTGSRDTFDAKWNQMPDAEAQVLRNFIKNTIYYSAMPFQWTDPSTGTVVDVYLKSVKKFELVSFKRWNVELELEEC